MAAQDRNVMSELLGVNSPWVVTDVRLTIQPSRLVSIQIEHAEAPAGFWSARRNRPVRRWLRWTHAGLADTRCEIVLALRDGQPVPDASWSGDLDSPFTRGLSRQAMDLLLQGATLEQLCRLLHVPFADLWKFKFRIDQGRAAAPSATAAGTVAATLPADDELPGSGDPLWMALLQGERDLDVRTLGLKLLLTKLRSQARGIRDDEVLMLKVVELHRFFTRNRAVLQHEISQLRRWSAH